MKATKQKTAKVISYAIAGTSCKACDVYYRNRRLFSICNEGFESANVKKAFEWGFANGFTHFKLTYN